MDEVQLISELKSKRTQNSAFKILVNTYKERLYWHIRHIVKIHDDADDVLQNTFIKAYKNINSFRGDSKLYSWLYRIATNEALNFIKKNQKYSQTNSEEFQNNLVNSLKADVYFEGDDIQLKLQRAIAKLPEKQQLVFNMRYFEALSYKEISDILDTSVGALKTSYHIAAKKIETDLIAID